MWLLVLEQARGMALLSLTTCDRCYTCRYDEAVRRGKDSTDRFNTASQNNKTYLWKSKWGNWWSPRRSTLDPLMPTTTNKKHVFSTFLNTEFQLRNKGVSGRLLQQQEQLRNLLRTKYHHHIVAEEVKGCKRQEDTLLCWCGAYLVCRIWRAKLTWSFSKWYSTQDFSGICSGVL